MAKHMTPQQIADKQVERTRTAVPFFEQGVMAVTSSPMAKAADNLDKAADHYAAKVRDGSMAKRLRAVSLTDWQARTVAKSSRIAEGVEQAKPRIAEFHEQRAAFQSSIDAELANMPTRTASEMDARMMKQVQKMRGFQFIPKAT